MATIVNTTPAERTTDNSLNLVVGIILAIAVILLIFYGLPYLTRSGGNGGSTGNTNTYQQNNPPQNNSQSNPGTNVNIPDHMNVNVQNQKPK